MAEYKGSNFLEYLKRVGINKTQAAKMLDISRQTLYQYFDSATLKRETVNKILTTFGTDEEEVFGNKKSVSILKERSSPYNAKFIAEFDYPMTADDRVTELGNGKYALTIPLVPEYGYAGYLSGWKDPEYLEVMPKHVVVVDHPPKGEYLAVEAVGESMENWTSSEMGKQSIRDGEIVTGRNIPQHYWSAKFHIHKFRDFIIVHNEGILIKRIIAHDVEKGLITCHSLNPDKVTYPDFQIDLREVKQMLNIVHPRR